MNVFEKRLSALEAAGGGRWRERGAFVVIDADKAEVHTNMPPYKPHERQRHNGESADDFQRRVKAETAKYGPSHTVMTRQQYEKSVARLLAEI